MAKPLEGKRRFAPIPIETTFEQYRKPGPAQGAAGPAAELTPEPSPRSTAPPSPFNDENHDATQHALLYREPEREKRRFAPQLIDSSRRSRRLGDVGPATRPVDKTDITPHTNHLYSLQRSRKRHHKITGLARRESCDEETADHVYNLAKKEIEKRLQEVALSAFPNSGVRIGGAEHFHMGEGSEDDDSDERESLARGRPQVRTIAPGTRRSRRDSSEEDISWHVKEAQDAAERRARSKSRVDTRELDAMQLDSPPENNTMWMTTLRQQTPSPRPYSPGPIGETHMPLMSGPGNLASITETSMSHTPSPPSPAPIGETLMPFIPSAPLGKAGHMAFIPPETGFQRHGGAGARLGFGGPFGAPGGFANRNLSFERRKNNNSPPMLGSDLVFRKCPSPKQTKLEPEHVWKKETEDTNRDPTGQRGLWRGYCYTAESGTSAECLAPVDRGPLMISTPMLLSSSNTDPFSAAFGGSPTGLSEEPTPLATPRLHTNGFHSAGPPSTSATLLPHSQHHQNNHHLHAPGLKRPPAASNESKSGLHMLVGLEERLRKEKAAADLEEQVQAEFTDRFVTQVYNYLSLGYPAMAWSYDEELSKISRISLDDLRRDDDSVMDGVIVAVTGAKKKGSPTSAKGHIKLTEDDDTCEQDRCPRWKALKLYIHEWARQHPDLDSISPLAWGVRERRGSWGI